MFDRILIPTDGSTPATEAARKGVELATEHDATVHVLSAVEPIPLGRFSTGPEPASAEHGKVVEEQKTEASDAVDSIIELCKEHNVDAVEAIVYGDPDQEIVDYVEEENMDAIVMGTHGRSGAERLIIGSVAEKVVRRSPVPVVTVRPSG